MSATWSDGYSKRLISVWTEIGQKLSTGWATDGPKLYPPPPQINFECTCHHSDRPTSLHVYIQMYMDYCLYLSLSLLSLSLSLSLFLSIAHTCSNTYRVRPSCRSCADLVNLEPSMGLDDIARPDTVLESVTGKTEVLDKQLSRKATVYLQIKPFVQGTMPCTCTLTTSCEVQTRSNCMC